MKNIAPTKTSLIRIKQELLFARQGYDLLDQKRNIIIMELLALVDQAVDIQDKTDSILAAAYEHLKQSILEMGKLRVRDLSHAVNLEAEIRIRQRKVMGVPLPVVETDFTENPPYYSPVDTSFWIEETVEKFKEALKLTGRLAELKISIIRLARDAKKTIRKVNALKKIAIPDLEETLHFIQSRLEENERDMFTLMKRVKSRLERTKMKKNEEAGK